MLWESMRGGRGQGWEEEEEVKQAWAKSWQLRRKKDLDSGNRGSVRGTCLDTGGLHRGSKGPPGSEEGLG